MWDDGVVQPHPPITRCLQQTVKSLEAVGHIVTSWDSKLHRELITCVDSMYFLDGGQEYEDILAAGNEPASPLMRWVLDRANPKTLHCYRNLEVEQPEECASDSICFSMECGWDRCYSVSC